MYSKQITGYIHLTHSNKLYVAGKTKRKKKKKQTRKNNLNGLASVILLIEYKLWREPQMGDLNWFVCLPGVHSHVSLMVRAFARVRVNLVFTNTYFSSIQSSNTSQLLHETSTEEIMVCFNAREKKFVEFMKPACQSLTWHHPK